MFVSFHIRGRLGNAIFRYLACAILCIHYNFIYIVQNNNNNDIFNCDDVYFNKISNSILNNNIDHINLITDIIMKFNVINMIDFYQNDIIYRKYKEQIIEFIQKNNNHIIYTDGISAGDGVIEKFYMIDILNTPTTFNKTYKIVLHIRLEDFVIHNMYIDKDRIIKIFEKGSIAENEICIVCKKPTSEFEFEYLNFIKNYLNNNNINVKLESNETIIDYYIMKEAEILICSKSTLSWSAAFFSNKLKKCYIPDYENSTFKYPIDNTEFY
jgi:hypothetical protein